MESITIIYSENASSAAYKLEELLTSTSLYKDEFEVIRWDEQHWKNNRSIQQGELGGIKIFLGRTDEVNNIVSVAKIVFQNHYVTCYKCGYNIVVLATPDPLIKSKEQYSAFNRDLEVVAPNRMKGNLNRKEMIFSFYKVKGGLRRVNLEKKNIVESQQLLYGAAMIVNQKLLNNYLVGDSND